MDIFFSRMRSCLVVKASDCQCTSCNGPGFDPSIRRHSGFWGAADEAVLNIVYKKIKKSFQKIILTKFFPVFSPDAKTAVLVYTNQRVVECSVETGRYTQFSHSLAQSMPAEWTARKFPIRGTHSSHTASHRACPPSGQPESSPYEVHTVLTQPVTEHASRVDSQEIPHSRYTVRYLPVFRIRIHWFRIRIPIWVRFWIRIVLTKITNLQLKYFFMYIFLSTNFNLLPFPGFHKGSPSCRRSFHPLKENIKNFKTWNFLTFFYFCGSLLPSWIRISDTDPLTWLNPDPTRIRIRNTVPTTYIPYSLRSVFITGSAPSIT